MAKKKEKVDQEVKQENVRPENKIARRVSETESVDDKLQEKPKIQLRQEEQEKSGKMRYIGKTILSFFHNGEMYQLIPNCVYDNLPQGAPQVKRLIKEGRLKNI